MTSSNGSGNEILRVEGLQKHFPVKRGLVFQKEVGSVKAVDGVNFTLNAGDTPASIGGMLAISDPDNTPAFVPQTSVGAIGTFSLAADGTWTYTTNSAALMCSGRKNSASRR